MSLTSPGAERSARSSSVSSSGRVTGDDDQLPRKVLRGAELRLDADLVVCGGVYVPECAQRIADSVALVLEAPADDRVQRMEPELGPGHHAKVATAPAQPPEELGLVVAIGTDHLARGGDQLGGDQVVAGERVLGGEVPYAAAEGEARDPGRADHAARRDQPMGLSRSVEIGPGGAAAGDREPRLRIDLDRPHPGEVDHQPVVDRAMPGGVVPAAPDRHLEVVGLGEGERRRHILRVDTARDRSRVAVDQQVEAGARPLVLAVPRIEKVPLQGFLQLFHVEKDRVNLANSSPGNRIFGPARSHPNLGEVKEILVPPLRAAAVAAFIAGLLLLFFNPPSFAHVGGLVTIGVGALAIVLLTAWLTVAMIGEEMPEPEFRRLVDRSEALASLPPPDYPPGEFDLLVMEAIDNLPPSSSACWRTRRS